MEITYINDIDNIIKKYKKEMEEYEFDEMIISIIQIFDNICINLKKIYKNFNFRNNYTYKSYIKIYNIIILLIYNNYQIIPSYIKKEMNEKYEFKKRMFVLWNILLN